MPRSTKDFLIPELLKERPKMLLFKNKLYQVLGLSLLLLFFASPSYALRASFAELGCQHISQIERTFLSYHVSYKKPDKNLEKKTVDQFIEKLDPSKIYFLSQDVNKIKKNMSFIITL